MSPAARGDGPSEASRPPSGSRVPAPPRRWPVAGQLQGGQEDLLYGPLDGANREALLELTVGAGLVEAIERGDQARR